MEKIKSIAINFVNKKVLIKAGIFVVFLAISIVAPFIKIQLITGSIVNAVLFVSTLVLGIEAGILIGFLPSLVSVFSGLLPVALLPMIPYIILGNAISVLFFGVLRKRNFWMGITVASFLKFIFLFFSSSMLIDFFIHKPLPAQIVSMMAWPQLITALTGGLVAWVISFLFNLKNNREKLVI